MVQTEDTDFLPGAIMTVTSFEYVIKNLKITEFN